MNLLLKNFFSRTIVKDNTGLNIYHVLTYGSRLDIFDFNSNSRIIVFSNQVSIAAQKRLLSSSKGVLIDGFS